MLNHRIIILYVLIMHVRHLGFLVSKSGPFYPVYDTTRNHSVCLAWVKRYVLIYNYINYFYLSQLFYLYIILYNRLKHAYKYMYRKWIPVDNMDLWCTNISYPMLAWYTWYTLYDLHIYTVLLSYLCYTARKAFPLLAVFVLCACTTNISGFLPCYFSVVIKVIPWIYVNINITSINNYIIFVYLCKLVF